MSLLKLIILLAPLAPFAHGLYQCQAVQPPKGSGIQCGVRGTATQAPTITFQAPFADCVALVDTDPAHLATFSYDSSQSLCANYTRNAALSTIGFQPDSASSAVFYDYRCFSCSDTCPEPTTTDVTQNRVLNPGFEDNVANAVANYSIAGWLARGKVVHPGANGSSNAFACYLQGVCYTEQLVHTCPFDVYLATFQYRLLGPYTGATIQSFFGDAILAVVVGASRDTGWRTIVGSFGRGHTAGHGNFTAGPNHDVFNIGEVLFTNGRSQSRVQVDNARVVPLPSPIPTQTGAPNLPRNAGFDNSATSIAPWQNFTGSAGTGGIVEVVSPGYGGSKHAVHLASNSVRYSGAEIFQTLAATAGTLYVFSFVWKLAGGATLSQAAFHGAFFVYIVTNGNFSASWLEYGGKQAPDGWFTFERLFVAQATDTQITITTNLDIVLDNVVFKAANASV